MAVPDIITHAGALLGGYDALFCDVWGVVHDGRRAFEPANDALCRFRSGGGRVILVSNAPMPSATVARILDDKGVRRDAWDSIVCSGDIALADIAERGFRRIHRIGPVARDAAFFERLPGQPTGIATADAIACTGLADDRRETPESYLPLLEAALARRLPLVCVNPDLVVHVGADLLPCAGAIAALYEGMGGPVTWAGKPHPAAYATARAAVDRLAGRPVPAARILAIGDAVRTDLAAAAAAGIDALFVAAGIHRHDVMDDGEIVPGRLARLFTAGTPPAIAAITALVW